jgi:hypothetical protein
MNCKKTDEILEFLVIGERTDHTSESRTPEAEDYWESEDYTPWTSVSIALVLMALAVGLSGLLGLQAYLPPFLLGIVGGSLVYEGGRLLLVRSSWPLLRTPAGRRLAAVFGVRRPVIGVSDSSKNGQP